MSEGSNDMTTIFREVDMAERREIVRQIGMNILAISGGRWRGVDGGIEMPAGAGYRVRVKLTAADDYTVERIYVRDGVEHAHGVRERVYCDEVAEVAYYASCFRSYDDEEWVTK